MNAWRRLSENVEWPFLEKGKYYCNKSNWKKRGFVEIERKQQKQPLRIKICICKNFAIFARKHLCWRLFLIELQAFFNPWKHHSIISDIFRGHKACNFIKNRLERRCFPVNIAKFLRTTFLWNTSGGTYETTYSQVISWIGSNYRGVLRTLSNTYDEAFYKNYLCLAESYIHLQKQPPEVFCEKRNSWKFRKIPGKWLCQSLFFNKVAGLRSATLLKKRLWRRYFPGNFAKFLRTPFSKEYLWWLCLHF